ncbi:SDR family oxidoreductase, partial [Listeria monocytogenes]|uniref:SDR family oxidoreductase n=1 Tax=Listeria monocytogenes TaxID=1639 RepID=UPI000A6ADAB0
TAVTLTICTIKWACLSSRAGVETLPFFLARRLGGKKKSFGQVDPDPSDAPLFLTGKYDKTIDNLAKATTLERLGQPEDIAETVAFLAGPARRVNGQVIFTNGGLA